jgi:glycosyltransferase involved in cell wall biosynthesis
MIKYSIIIPTYNSEKYIERCINSIYVQNLNNYELIVIDNNSSDKTIELIQQNKIYSKCKIIKINNFGIVAKSRNIGLSESKGEWICFLDSDDFWHPNKLLECDQYTNQFDVIYHKLRYYDIKDKIIKFKHQCDTNQLNENTYSSLLDLGIALTTSGILVKKSALIDIGGFDEELKLIGGEDLDLWLRLAKNGYRFKYIKKILAFYMIGGGHHVTSNKTGINLNAALKSKYSSDRKIIFWIELSLFRISLNINRKKFYLSLFTLLKNIGIFNTPKFSIFLLKRSLKRFINYIS